MKKKESERPNGSSKETYRILVRQNKKEEQTMILEEQCKGIWEKSFDEKEEQNIVEEVEKQRLDEEE